MKSFNTISAILGGKWLIQKEYADRNMPLIASLLKGNAVDFGIKEKGSEVPIITLMGSKSMAAYGISDPCSIPALPEGSIAVVQIIGPQTKYGGMCSYGMIDKAALIAQLDAASNVAGIVMNIDSPGGQVSGTSNLADAIANCSKPVVGVVNDGIAASAAMWIGSACDELYVTHKMDEVGSVGVYCTLADYAKFYESQGLTIHEIYAPQSTDKNKDYKDAMAGDYTLVEEDLSFIADNFISTVAANRGSKATLNQAAWSTGKMFNAKEAKKVGLIDGIKSFDQVLQRTQDLSRTKTSSKNAKNNNIMSKNANVFQNVLVAAGAESFEVVANIGFGVTEDQMNAIDARLGVLIAGEATNKEALTVANTALTAAQQTVTETAALNATQAAEIATLKATVEEYAPKAAKIADPKIEKDNYENKDGFVETSVDREKREMNKNWGVNPAK